MTENKGFRNVKVTKQKLRDVATIIHECRQAFEKAVEECSGLDTNVYQVLTIKQKQQLKKQRDNHIMRLLYGECDDILERLDSWGFIEMREIKIQNNTLFDETRHSQNATPTHIVCERQANGSVTILGQFASQTEAQQFIDANGYGFIVKI